MDIFLIKKFVHLVERGRYTFIGFGLVGSLGLIVNITAFSMCRYVFGLDMNLSVVFAYSCAVSNNYVLNHLWTFASRTYGHSFSLRLYGKYYLGNSMGLFSNLLVFNVLVSFFGVNWEVFFQLVAIMCGTIFNFLIASLWIFRNREQEV